MAIEIKGNWKKGFALALHTISSTYLGKNEFGYDHYDTIRTKIGELVYKLKYQNDSTAVQKLVNEIKKCISGIERFDLIIPVPPSNKNRPKQPVILVCEAISKEFNVPFLPNALVKSSAARELKDITDTDERKKELQNVIKITAVDRIEGGKILLIDDLYRSGATLMAVTDILYSKGKAKSVSVLTLTKTRRNR